MIEAKIIPLAKKFYSDETNYGIFICTSEDEIEGFDSTLGSPKFVIVGITPPLVIGRKYDSCLEKTTHPVYGVQFKILSINVDFEESIEDEEKLLWTIVTPKQFKNIIEVYPSPITTIMNNEFDCSKVKGIGVKTLDLITSKINKNKLLMKAFSELSKFGLTTDLIKKINDFYKDVNIAIDVVKNNPYRLYHDIDGIGFIKADKIAISVGIAQTDFKRIVAGIEYAVECQMKKGHTWTNINEIHSDAEEILGIGFTDIIDYIEESKQLILINDEMLGFNYVYNCEKSIKERLDIINEYPHVPIFPEASIQDKIEKIEEELGITYTDSQRDLFYKINNEKIIILTGYAGTGKTSTLNGCLWLLEEACLTYILLSPTAKASMVLSEATGEDAYTIHRALKYNPLCKNKFVHDENNPLQKDVVVVDEASMVDIFLMNSLLKAIKDDSKVVFVGDPAQLESVAVGNVLNDIIVSNRYSLISLDKVFRQSLDSGIISVATDVRYGKIFYSTDDSNSLEIGIKKDCKVWFGENEDTASRVISIFKKCIEKYNIEEIMILSPMKKGVSGVASLNQAIQEIYNPSNESKNEYEDSFRLFREGDKVIHTINMYNVAWLDFLKEEDYNRISESGCEIYTDKYYEIDSLGIFNGETGTIIEIDRNNKEIYVKYDEKIIRYTDNMFNSLELAYVMTIHKSQGSGAKVVIMALDTSHYMNLKRSLVYTGITRAKDWYFLVANKRALSISIRNDQTSKKRTFLKYLYEMLDK